VLVALLSGGFRIDVIIKRSRSAVVIYPKLATLTAAMRIRALIVSFIVGFRPRN
jgi:hypothetical protein